MTEKQRPEAKPGNINAKETLSSEQQREICIIYAANYEKTDSLYPTLQQQAIAAASEELIERRFNTLPKVEAINKIISYHRTRRSNLQWALQADEKHPNYRKTKKYIDMVLSRQGFNPDDFTIQELQNLAKIGPRGGFITFKDIFEARKKESLR